MSGGRGACDDCLRRSALLGRLTLLIGRNLDERRPIPAMLELDDRSLIDAVAGSERGELHERHDRFDAARARRAAQEAGLGSVCRHGTGFPAALLEPADAPSMLYLRGDQGVLERLGADPAVAVVGSRRASPYGLELAASLARELAACGLVVVSGMALGADSAAHEGALASRGTTLAVLAGGVDVPYPRRKGALYRRIVAEGLVVSEMPPGTTPLPWCFPARNRIMAGLSAMTVVVEGAESSGSLITARFAADLGREVGAVPGQVTSALAHGPNALLADGACVVRSATDVLDALYGPGSAQARRAAPGAGTRATPKLEEPLASLLRAVEQGKSSPDEIATRPDAVAAVLAGLTELELMGLVRRGPEGGYTRCA